MKHLCVESGLLFFRKNFPAMLSCIFPLAVIVLLSAASPQVAAGKIYAYRSFALIGGFKMSFSLDRLSLGLGVLVSALYLLVTIYSTTYITGRRLTYYLLLLLNFGSLLGILFAQDLLGFYLFFETLSISAYFLIIHSREHVALDAGYKYIVMMLVGGLFILTAMMVLYIATEDRGNSGHLAGFCFSIGCLLKAGAFPFHPWLPDAHPAAPSPISALLSGVMIKVGAYGLMRAFLYPDLAGTTSAENQVFTFISLRRASLGPSVPGSWWSSPALLMIITGVLSMVIGVSLALMQKDLKKLLAYHSVSQIGYILVGLGIGNDGLVGGILHIVSHAIFKGLLFLAVGAVIFRTGTRRIDRLGGLWRAMPVTTVTCLIAAISISGVPLTSGYVSKGMLFEGLKGSLPLAIIFVLTSAGTCASFLKLMRHTFFGPPNSEGSSVKEIPASMAVPMLLLSAGSLVIGIFPNFALKALLGSSAPEPHLWTVAHLAEALVSLGIGAALYVFLLRTGVFGFTHSQAAVQPWGHRVQYISVDRSYTSLARGLILLCATLEKIQSNSLSISIQLVVSFLVIIMATWFLL